MAEPVAIRMIQQGLGRRVHIEDYSNFDWVSSPGLLVASQASCPLVREEDNLDQAEAFGDGLCSLQNYKLAEHPLIAQWSVFSVMFWFYQDPIKPIDFFPDTLSPGTDHFLTMSQQCTHGFYREMSQRLLRFNSEVALYNAVGPTARLFAKAVRRQAVAQRLVRTYSLEDLVKAKMTVFHLGSGKPHDRVLFRLHNLALQRLARDHWMRNQQPLWMHCLGDEAHTYIGEPEAAASAETLKMGQSWTFVSTRLDYGSDTVNDLLDQNCRRKVIFRCGPRIADEAKKELRANLDPYLLHHNQESFHSLPGLQEEVPTESEAEAFDKDGNKIILKRRGTAFRQTPEIVKQVTPHYFGLNDQDLLNITRVQTMPRFHYALCEGDQLTFGQVKQPQQRWTVAQGQELLQAFMERRGETGRYRQPVPFEEAKWIGSQKTPKTPKTPKKPQGSAAKVRGKPRSK
jgi:hypothetical protein